LGGFSKYYSIAFSTLPSIAGGLASELLAPMGSIMAGFGILITSLSESR
jgi:hypothetical protein